MANFTRLTSNKDGSTVYVNLDHVISIDVLPDFRILYLTNNTSISVKEEINAII